jgi:hypothetical protein
VVEILCVASIPLVALASLVCFASARSVASHPFPWTLGAVFVALLTGTVLAGLAGVIFSLMVSVPAAMLFLFAMRQWPMTAGST